jgi:hypothetical protein
MKQVVVSLSNELAPFAMLMLYQNLLQRPAAAACCSQKDPFV